MDHSQTRRWRLDDARSTAESWAPVMSERQFDQKMTNRFLYFGVSLRTAKEYLQQIKYEIDYHPPLEQQQQENALTLSEFVEGKENKASQ
ncbi:MAG: hypothetical protein ACRDF4_02005 [Rhabdochlamydiaceae bacterium]